MKQKQIFHEKEIFDLKKELSELKVSNEDNKKQISDLRKEMSYLILTHKYHGVLQNVSLKQLLNEGFKVGMKELYSYKNTFEEFQKFKKYSLVVLAARMMIL